MLINIDIFIYTFVINMGNKYFKISFFGLAIVALFASKLSAFDKISYSTDSASHKSTLKFKDNRPNRPIFHAIIPANYNSFMIKMNAAKQSQNVKATAKSNPTIALETQKPIDNFKVYPNPVSDQFNLSFTLKKESFVTIKVLDVLGNEVMTLFGQKLSAGDQSNTFYINSKLNSGFYFIRIIADSDAIIKRISVL